MLEDICTPEQIEKMKEFRKKAEEGYKGKCYIFGSEQFTYAINMLGYFEFKNFKILEFGPGNGMFLYTGFKKFNLDMYALEVQGQDTWMGYDNYYDILNITDRVKFYDGINDYPFEDNEFDVLVAKNSIHRINNINNENITDYTKRFTEITRVLKPNGMVVILPNNKKQMFVHNWLKKIGNPKNLKIGTIVSNNFIEYKG